MIIDESDDTGKLCPLDKLRCPDAELWGTLVWNSFSLTTPRIFLHGLKEP